MQALVKGLRNAGRKAVSNLSLIGTSTNGEQDVSSVGCVVPLNPGTNHQPAGWGLPVVKFD
jgi:hypothetical protein